MAKAKKIQQQFNFDPIKKFELSNATVTELRTGVFAPIEKISANSITNKNFIANKRKREIETSWGKMIIMGNILTQTHRDILDCIMANAKDIKETKDENGDTEIEIFFSAYEALRAYSKKCTRNTKWLKDKLDEIKTSAIEIKTDMISDNFDILSKVGYNKRYDSFRVVFSKDYVKYFLDSVSINYKDELPKLLNIDSALLRAIIRFFWTHNKIQIEINNLLRTIGFPMESPRTTQLAKKEIKDNAELLKSFGITYEHDNKNRRIIYLKSSFENTISFVNPIKTALLSEDGFEDDEGELIPLKSSSKLSLFVDAAIRYSDDFFKIENIYESDYGYALDLLDEQGESTRLKIGSPERPADERIVFNFLNESRVSIDEL